jgi:uncharacterized protein YjiS (DUF1127 family)
VTRRIASLSSGYTQGGQRCQHRSSVPINPLAVPVRNILAVVEVWRARSRFRREFAARSENELQDMGTCWSSIADEISKPFWRG